MSRYFFHLQDGISLEDDEGTVYPSPEKAKREAIRFGGSLIRDFPDHKTWTVIVKEESGAIVTKLLFSVAEQC